MFLSKRSNGTYYIFYEQENGKRTCVSTKTKLKKDANLFLGQFYKKIDTLKKQSFIPVSLKEFSVKYLKHSELSHTWKTTLTYQTTFNKIIDHFGNIQLSELNKNRIEDFISFRVKKVSAYAGRKDVINIKAMLNWAVENNFLNVNPSNKIKRIKTPEKLPVFFTNEDFDKLIANIDSEDLKDLVIFAVNSGMRQGEIINLEFSQIDFRNRRITLDNQNHVTKSKKVRSIPLNEIAFQLVSKRIEKNGSSYVFSVKGNKINQDFLIHRFKKFIIDTGLNPKLKFHSLRHTFASWLVQKGVSIYEVSKLLGHSEIN
jgi:integrase